MSMVSATALAACAGKPTAPTVHHADAGAGGAPPSEIAPHDPGPPVALASAENHGFAAARQPEPRQLSAEQAEELMRQATDPQLPSSAREAAAARLITETSGPAAALARRVILATEPDLAPRRAVLIAAVTRAIDPAPDLFAALAESLDAAPPESAPAVIEAIGSFRTRAAASLLLTRASPDRPAAERSAAFRALARMTGHDEFGARLDRWTSWFDEQRGSSESAWARQIASGLAARADRLAVDRRDAVARLVDVNRRLYLSFAAGPSPGDQVRLLGALLEDPRDDLRWLAFDILSREVSSGRAVDPSLQAAVVRLVRDTSPTVRARAAMVVRQLDPPGASAAVADALAAEAVPESAAALLLAAARWPSEACVDPALRWLRNGSETRAAAVQALLSLARAGLLTDADRDRVAGELRVTLSAEWTPAECRLVALVGTRDDRERVAELIEGAPGPLRTAAADALADDPAHLDRLIRAADPELFDIVARAIARHRSTASGLLLLREVAAPSLDARRSAMLQVAAVLPTGELLRAATLVEDQRTREAMLARLAGPFPPGDADADTLGEGLNLLAETRLALGNPESALIALDAANGTTTPARARSEFLRVVALLVLGRIDEASALDAPASAWLEGLAQAISRPHARSIVDAVAARFSAGMSPADAQKFESLRRRLGVPPR